MLNDLASHVALQPSMVGRLYYLEYVGAISQGTVVFVELPLAEIDLVCACLCIKPRVLLASMPVVLSYLYGSRTAARTL